jgi:hypothetical protein
MVLAMRNANDKRYTSNKKAASSSRDTIAAGRHSVSIKNKRRFFMVLFTIPVGAEKFKMNTSATRCSWVDSPLVTVYLKQQKCHLK